MYVNNWIDYFPSSEKTFRKIVRIHSSGLQLLYSGMNLFSFRIIGFIFSYFEKKKNCLSRCEHRGQSNFTLCDTPTPLICLTDKRGEVLHNEKMDWPLWVRGMCSVLHISLLVMNRLNHTESAIFFSLVCSLFPNDLTVRTYW